MSIEVVISPVKFTDAEITEAIALIRKSGQQFARGVESLLVMSVYDSIINESSVVANALIGALRKSTKQQGIVAFLEKFGKLYDKGGRTGFVFFNLGAQASLAWTPDYVAAVKEAAMDWESFKPAPAAPELDVVKALESIVTKSGKEGCVVTHADLVPYISALIAQYTAKAALEAAQASAAIAAAPMGQVAVTA